MQWVAVLALLVLLALPVGVTVRARALLLGPPDAPGRRAAVVRVCTVVVTVAAVQVLAGYALARFASALGGSEGPSGTTAAADAGRPWDVTVALGPALVLAAALAEAVVRRRGPRLYALGLWGNAALVPAGLLAHLATRPFAP